MSFYFVTFLIPIVIATSAFFNRYLVPQYLLKNRKKKFALYFIYMLIVSIYLEMLVMILSFVILADYQIENLGKIAGDIYLLTVILYLIVLVEGLILATQKLREHAVRIKEVEEELSREQRAEIMLKVNRKNVPVVLEDILYIESLGDYVKVYTKETMHTTKGKISGLSERLPNLFLRVHRSFIVNKNHIEFFTKEHIQINGLKLPIGRKYKKETEMNLSATS